ncbi:hypothetical protein [Bradyrhizobium sp. USDA 4486]
MVWREVQRALLGVGVAPAGGARLPGLTFLLAGTTLTIDQKLQWFGTVRGRVGILATPKVLFYGTRGLAFGEIKTTGTMGGFTPGGIAVASIGLDLRDPRRLDRGR